MTIEVTQAPDGKDIEGQITTQLAYLSRLARQLGVNDPVEEYFAPVVGRWSDMHAEAERWRTVGEGVEQVTEALNKPLGKLDAAWEGEAADSFIGYMQQVGLAGNDLTDAMSAMADVLDQTADSIREIVVELAGVMADTAESASEAMSLPVQGDTRTREYLDLMRRPTKELFEAVRQVLEAFVELCEGAEGDDMFGAVTMAHTYPAEDWSYVVPSTPGAPSTPGGTDIPVDTGTDAAALGGGAGDFGGGLGGGMGGGGAAAAAAMDSPLAPGNSTVAGEQAPHSTSAPGGAAAAAASAGAAKGGAGSGMMPMSPMMGGQGQGQSDQTHKSRARVVGNPQDIFGKPERASTPVIGADD